jgi:hypothetical protein
MMRFIFMILIGLVAAFAWRNRMGKHNAPAIKPQQAQSAQPPQSMVSCKHCHVNIPSNEAVTLTNQGHTHHFCSQEHLRLHMAP